MESLLRTNNLHIDNVTLTSIMGLAVVSARRIQVHHNIEDVFVSERLEINLTELNPIKEKFESIFKIPLNKENIIDIFFPIFDNRTAYNEEQFSASKLINPTFNKVATSIEDFVNKSFLFESYNSAEKLSLKLKIYNLNNESSSYDYFIDDKVTRFVNELAKKNFELIKRLKAEIRSFIKQPEEFTYENLEKNIIYLLLNGHSKAIDTLKTKMPTINILLMANDLSENKLLEQMITENTFYHVVFSDIRNVKSQESFDFMTIETNDYDLVVSTGYLPVKLDDYRKLTEIDGYPELSDIDYINERIYQITN